MHGRAAAALPEAPRSAEFLRMDAARDCAESTSVLALLPAASLSAEEARRARPLARTLAHAVRTARRDASGVDALLAEFPLSSHEGLALMGLAESLLRIPDTAARDRLIAGAVHEGNWTLHADQAPSWWVRLASEGLRLGAWVVSGLPSGPNFEHARNSPGDASVRSGPQPAALDAAWRSALRRCGAPLLRSALLRAMGLLGKRFVCGESIEEALQRSAALRAQGFRHSFDMLGEAVLTSADAEQCLAAYERAIHAIGNLPQVHDPRLAEGVSVKLSALHPRFTWNQRSVCFDEWVARLAHLAGLAKSYGIGLTVDAEEFARLEITLDVFSAVARLPALADWNGLGIALQAYHKAAPALLDALLNLARETRRCIPVRLVKGAYWDTEIQRAQAAGLAEYPVFTRKEHTDLSYLALARRLLAARPLLFPQFATHNAASVAALLALRDGLPGQEGLDGSEAGFEFQCLFSMGETLYTQLAVQYPHPPACRIYAPVGPATALLPYLVRRLLENGANNSFVHQILDEDRPIAELIADPAETVRGAAAPGAGHPAIVLPGDLYGANRRNAAGYDLSQESLRAALWASLAAGANPQEARATPVDETVRPEPVEGAPATGAQAIHNPARADEVVGWLFPASAAEIRAALQRLAHSSWPDLPVAERAARLQEAARRIEEDAYGLAALLVREAGKSLANALAEVRETVDFLRYYALQATTARQREPLIAISPWNFPLAIACGQVAAALAAGRAVGCKPAEQTPLVAARALQSLRAAGIGEDALAFLPGDNQTGAALVAEPGIGGVLFTGSHAVACQIAARLAARSDEPILVAETGGVNAMIADATALPEQLVADCLRSAFDAAGQRCSALRLLCVHEAIAARVLELLRGAMACLRLGDPALAETDVGPLIDRAACARVEAALAHHRAHGRSVFQAQTAQAPWIAPALVEISAPSNIPGEIFGPVLHVLRFRAQAQEDFFRLQDDIEALGYALSFGIHSRDAELARILAERSRAGNVYVQRETIAAVVGAQPFGGLGLSGTGPKAGGPLLVARLAGQIPQGLEAAGRSAKLTSPATLSSALENWLAQTPAQEALHAWAERGARLREQGHDLRLPGVAGEENHYRLRPLGSLWIDAPALTSTLASTLTSTPSSSADMASPGAWARRALVLAISTGNRCACTAQTLESCGPLPAELLVTITVRALPFDGACDGLLVGDAQRAAELRLHLARAGGALLPVVVLHGAEQPGEFDFSRFMREQSVCLNTAAQGGNAALLSLS